MSNKVRRALLIFVVVVLASCFVHPLTWAETSINVSGVWEGVNYTNQIPGPHVVQLVLRQEGNKVTGSYRISTGASGTGEGTVSGSSMEIFWKNTPPSCPGEYRNKYLISEDQIMWKFSGKDCLGQEEGHGYAAKESR